MIFFIYFRLKPLFSVFKDRKVHFRILGWIKYGICKQRSPSLSISWLCKQATNCADWTGPFTRHKGPFLTLYILWWNPALFLCKQNFSYNGHVKRKSTFKNAKYKGRCAKKNPGLCSSSIHSIVSNDSVSGQWRSWFFCSDEQADLGLRCPHMLVDMISHSAAYI